jgi:polyphosphate kinase
MKDSTHSPRLLNRELSWLDFNERVLELAKDESIPLLERTRFCAIFSSNLDEFFMVRVAGLLDQAATGLPVRSFDGLAAKETLAAVRERSSELVAQQSQLWKKQLAPALKEAGIVVGRLKDCNRNEMRLLTRRYKREIFPILTPLAVSPGQPFPYISGLSLSLGVLLRNPDSNEERFARVKVPEGLGRFIDVDDGRLLVPTEDLISHHLDSLFPGMEILEQSHFRLARDADMELSDDASDLFEAVQEEIRHRRFGDVVRLEVEESISEKMLEILCDGLEIGRDLVYPVQGLLDLAGLQQLADLDRPELKYEPWLPITQSRLTRAHDDQDIFAEIRRGDIFVHYPYESFATSYGQFTRTAAADPALRVIKASVYRTNDESPVVPSLIEAAEAGRQSVCLVELKARFEERRNLRWGHELEQSGVHVVYGFPHLKIHAKMTLVVRQEGEQLRRYAHIGTGNYNSLTALSYEDLGFFTADEELTADVADLFNFLTGFGRTQEFRKLLVAPLNMRPRLIELIRSVAEAARSGERAVIRLKVNALTDPKIIEELLLAAAAGAKIEIIARSICMLIPEPGISVRSVLGRFLEHSRVYIFHAGDSSTYLLGSADLMPRNLDHRVEILAPVESQRARTELNTVFDTLLASDRQAWELTNEGRWQRCEPKHGKRPLIAQDVLIERASLRARRQAQDRDRLHADKR